MKLLNCLFAKFRVAGSLGEPVGQNQRDLQPKLSNFRISFPGNAFHRDNSNLFTVLRQLERVGHFVRIELIVETPPHNGLLNPAIRYRELRIGIFALPDQFQ